MNKKSMFIPLALGLGLTVALMWLLSPSGSGLPVARAASYTVCPAGPPTCDYSVIQDAVDAAGDGDVIKVATGTYDDINNYNGLAQVVYIIKSVTIRGGYTTAFAEPPDPEANPTILDAGGQGRVIYIEGNINPTIEGLRITGGRSVGPWGWGGGVRISGAAATIRNNQIFSNTAHDGGGLRLDNSAAILEGNTIYSNTVDDGGGGLFLSFSPATLIGNNISGNTAFTNAVTAQGGGLWISGAAPVLNGNTISRNSAGSGGGIFLHESDATLTNNLIFDNQADWGGGVQIYGAAATIRNNQIFSNTAHDGGGLRLDNSAAILEGNTIYSNTVDDGGGGLFLSFSPATLIGNNISGNTAFTNAVTAQGGGLWISGAAPVLNGNTISRNSAGSGGGIFLHESDATLTNNLIFDNQAGFGSGISAGECALRLLHTTIAHNTDGDGVGIRVSSGTVALTNTIIVSQTVGIVVEYNSSATLEATLWGTATWANTTDWSGDGTIITGTVNLWGDPAFVDPDNGDYHIGENSAAIDAGVDAGVTNDIDFHPRPYLIPDIGADEYWPPGMLKFIYLPLVMR
ncbi:MAG: hypothetical protein E3J37_07905 [Anaerolineales bacterium]|nr:MAG: hypothetical protein E3J37_07905 [Anaerolineales bacterium]